MQPDFPRQRARFARCPELLDVARLVVVAIRQHRTELLLPSIAPAADGYGLFPASCAAVAAEHNHLLSRKQIRETARLQVVQFDTGSRRKSHVSQHRTRDLRGQRANRALDVLARTDVLRRAPCPLRQPIEQIGIHIIADPKREDPEPPSPLLGALGDPLRICLTRTGLPVREEHDHAE